MFPTRTSVCQFRHNTIPPDNPRKKCRLYTVPQNRQFFHIFRRWLCNLCRKWLLCMFPWLCKKPACTFRFQQEFHHVSPVRRFLLRTGRVRLAHRRDLARQYHATAGTRQMERLAKKSHVPPTAKLVPTVRHAQLATAIMHWKTAFVWISVETMSNLKAALAKSIVFRITEKSVCLQSALPAVHTGKK